MIILCDKEGQFNKITKLFEEAGIKYRKLTDRDKPKMRNYLKNPSYLIIKEGRLVRGEEPKTVRELMEGTNEKVLC